MICQAAILRGFVFIFQAATSRRFAWHCMLARYKADMAASRWERRRAEGGSGAVVMYWSRRRPVLFNVKSSAEHALLDHPSKVSGAQKASRDIRRRTRPLQLTWPSLRSGPRGRMPAVLQTRRADWRSAVDVSVATVGGGGCAECVAPVTFLHVACDRQASAQRVVGSLTRLQGGDSAIQSNCSSLRRKWLGGSRRARLCYKLGRWQSRRWT
jgi:hypothetical protein